ncbi:MAG TPA: DNA translocase FtsK [Chitinophagaceae bacterium]
MANRLKKKTPPPPDPEKLVEDKPAEVTVTEVVKDERTWKIAGAVSLLFCIFLFIAFTSYLFTWQEDQDKVHQFGIRIFAVDDVRVSNLLGVVGAYTAHLFLFKGFGLASYLLCSFFFVLGVNLLFEKKIFNIVRNIRYIITGLVIISMALAFFTPDSGFSFGGAVGELLCAWFNKWIGKVGTGAMLTVAGFSYFIWRFNPRFHWPERKPKPLAATTTEGEADDLRVDPGSGEELVLNEYEDDELPEDGFSGGRSINDLYADGTLAAADEEPTSNNKLKGEGKGVFVMMPQPETTADALTEFGLNEKAEENLSPASLPLTPEIAAASPGSGEAIVNQAPVIDEQEDAVEGEDGDGLELEINEGVEEEEVEETAVPVKAQPVSRYDPVLDLRDYKYPSLDLLETHGSEKIIHNAEELETHKNQIIATLKNYDISIQRISATVGPTVTLYEIVPAPGVRISRIKNLEDDIALSLAALGIRIIAPIPGKGTIGIEVPNVKKTVVSMKTLLASEKFQNNSYSLPIAIGKKIDNENFIVDLASMPHLLMAGATGQGKSVGVNALLVSLLYKKHPSQLKFVLVDPKKVELSLYRVIEKHFLARLPGEEESIITDTKKVIYTLNALCIEMDNRYDLLKEAHCRNIKEYNEKFTARKLNPEKGHQYLPFIVLVIDEFADLIMTAGKEIEMPIARLAQLARAVGIHLIIATQRPSVNIITGTIKANFPARIAFKVSSKIDSRTILDAGGAEQLIGKGDMLVSYNGEITRLQCAFVDTPEVESICQYIGEQRGYPHPFLLPEYVDEKDMEGRDFDLNDKDPLFEDAARLIVSSQMGSTSLIQRRMKLGYNRAGRLMDQLEAAGVVGPNQGSKAREVIIKTDADLQELLSTMG